LFPSRYNLICPVSEDDSRFLLMNHLSGHADIVDAQERHWLDPNAHPEADSSEGRYLQERGYLYRDRSLEQELLQERFAEFRAIQAESPTQVHLGITYGCNLSCEYCYQKGVAPHPATMTPAMFEQVLETVHTRLAASHPQFTLFGGEPLMAGHKKLIHYIVRRCQGERYPLSVVTNGYELLEFVDVLEPGTIREIQVTVDGPAAVHDRRRPARGGRPSYDRVFRGIEACVHREIPINLRIVLDQSNLEHLVNLARIVDDQGWLNLSRDRFKTQIGRNYELFDCQDGSRLFSQLGLWQEYVKLSAHNPVLLKFHQPEFKGVRCLVETGEMGPPSFDTCPACKKEWVFDPCGDIYGCTATCGRPELKVGSYFPVFRLDEDAAGQWARRNTTTISECRDCGYATVCGGGCGALAYRNSGRILSPDCRPVKELLSLGARFYRDRIEALASDIDPDSQ